MSEFWRAKIWALLHAPPLKALYSSRERGHEGPWKSLACMDGWVSPKAQSLTDSNYSTQWLRHIGLCDEIASASDRTAVFQLTYETAIDYHSDGLEIRHLLSGASQKLQFCQWHDYLMSLSEAERDCWLAKVEESLIPESIRTCLDARKVFWWLWRCYPRALSRALEHSHNILDEPSLPLLPADTRIPDASVWSHVTMTSALAGSLASYSPEVSACSQKGAVKETDYQESRPHIAIFSFTPVQELIKASRKMRDFWAGSWLLHYLSAKICWAIAWKYGPDTLLYPCLYEQPLIDLWLLQEYEDFFKWIKRPSNRQLLTAGFPNVLVMIVPDNGAYQTTEKVKNPIKAAMQQAEETLRKEWMKLGQRVLDRLQDGKESWIPNLNLHTWDEWLKSQWQVYWVALPIGDTEKALDQSPNQEKYHEWLKAQNKFSQPSTDLFVASESRFLKATYNFLLKNSPPNLNPSNLNVGSWWASIFDQIRYALNAVKNVRTWEVPTAFGPRSTVSGLGPVVHPIYDSKKPDWATEKQTAESWSTDKNMGLFDGIEELNAAEVLKRGLHRILAETLFPKPSNDKQEALEPSQPIRLDLFYPDLTSGAAGWLRYLEKQNSLKGQKTIDYYLRACREIQDEFSWANTGTNDVASQSWGIPWIASVHPDWLHPRLLNAGWLIEDFQPKNPQTNEPWTIEKKRILVQEELRKLREFIDQKFLGNNPTDWYVLAAGDGDGMSNWLKGEPLQAYSEYVPQELEKKLLELPQELQQPFKDFLNEKKRMGPATHSAFSRALLDFSNQLVPYLTEDRYAGRLIYGGGDDVLAYTNLWEWDSWVWDIRQCFRGAKDPIKETPEHQNKVDFTQYFQSEGDYWEWQGEPPQFPLAERPLFTMGRLATISFGLVIANQSVPLAIALENLWQAEEEAKEYEYYSGCSLEKNCCSLDNRELKYRQIFHKKDAVQVRVLYGNGNCLKATAQFDAFAQWKSLLNAAEVLLDASNYQNASAGIENASLPALFEQAAQIWSQHPAPQYAAIAPWTAAFCNRRDVLQDSPNAQGFHDNLGHFLRAFWVTTYLEDSKKLEEQRNREISNWLKLAAFALRKRQIQIGNRGGEI